MTRLLYPLRYFRLRAQGFVALNVWPTLVLTFLIAAPFIFIPGGFFWVDGFLDKIVSITSSLSGFFVAALVAAATFSHPDLDKEIRSGPIVLLGSDSDGRAIQERLTRREFACTIFGYLAFVSILLAFAGAMAVGLSMNGLAAKFAVSNGSTAIYLWLRGVVIVLFAVPISHLIVATGLGLYYLMDRLYRHDQVITSKKNGAGKAA